MMGHGRQPWRDCVGLSVSIAMPALDEAEGIDLAVRSAVESLDALVTDGTVDGFELLVVDDGSTDATADLVTRLAAQDARVLLLRHDRNRGVGAGLRTAIEHARCDLVLSTDADMPVDLHELRNALPRLADAGVGIVVGHRSTFDGESSFRTVASRAYDRISRLAFATAHPDVNFPFKLLRTQTARDLGLRSEGALIDVELLARVEASGLDVVSLPMGYRSRQLGQSKTMRPRLLAQLGIEMVRYRRAFRAGP